METEYYCDYEIRKNPSVGISIKINPLKIFGIYGILYFPQKYCNDLLSAMREAKDRYIVYKELAMQAYLKDIVQELLLNDTVLSHCFWKDLYNHTYLDRNVQLSFYFCVSEINHETMEYSLDIDTKSLQDGEHRCLGCHITLRSEQEIDKFINAITLS